jgi:hypothetical protein
MIGAPDADSLAPLVRFMLARPPTPVSQPIYASMLLTTKQGRSLRISAQHQTLHNEHRQVCPCVRGVCGACKWSFMPLPADLHVH